MALVEVFRSSRKSATYLYLPKGADPMELPAALREVFGTMELVLGLDLMPERQLARYSGSEVLAAIAEQGFFLQMPDDQQTRSEVC